MSMQKLLLVATAGIAVLFGAAPATAQNSTTGAIAGVVTDTAGKTLEGVAVIVTSPALQGQQTAFTGGDGSYKITNLPPGTYLVAFYYGELQVRRMNIPVSTNKTTSVFQKIDPNQAAGTKIDVEAAAPQIDLRSTNAGVT